MSIQSRHVAMRNPFTYYVCVPDEIENLANLPIIVFLHGFGERGDDPASKLNGGLDSLFESMQLRAIVIFPQCDFEHRAFYGAMEERVLRAIEDSRQAFNASPNLVYLTGYSMGASSCLLLAARLHNPITVQWDAQLIGLRQLGCLDRFPFLHISLFNAEQIEKCVRDARHVGAEPLDVQDEVPACHVVRDFVVNKSFKSISRNVVQPRSH